MHYTDTSVCNFGLLFGSEFSYSTLTLIILIKCMIFDPTNDLIARFKHALYARIQSLATQGEDEVNLNISSLQMTDAVMMKGVRVSFPGSVRCVNNACVNAGVSVSVC